MSDRGVSSPQPPVSSEEAEFSVSRLIALGLITRLVIDTAIQIFFPFLPLIAEGLRTSPVQLARLVSLRSLMGLMSPLFGSLAERRGYRYVMRLGLFVAGVGYLGIGMSQNLWHMALAMLLAGIGTFSFVPTIQAYLSSRLPYNLRARGIGILEYAWALAGIVGLFLAGELIARTSWRVPFFILGGLLLVAFWYYSRLPASGAARQSAETSALHLLPRFKHYLNFGANKTSAWAVILSGALIMFAGMNLNISYGTWLSAEYGLEASSLGRVALLAGLMDLTGSVLVSLISDRIGKRLSVTIGSAVTLIIFLVLPSLNFGLTTAVIGLVLFRFGFEFSVVSNLAFLSEQVPTQRAKVFTISTAFVLTSGAVAGLTGPWAYERAGLWGISIIAAAALVVTLLLQIWLTREPELEP